MSQYKVMFTLLSLVTMITVTYGCTCMLPKHPQQHFCNSDFVIRAYIRHRSQDLENYLTQYQVHVLDVLKVPENSSIFHTTQSNTSDEIKKSVSYNRTTNDTDSTTESMYTTESVTDHPTESVTEPMELVLNTPLWSSLCGVYLEEYKVYIIGGHIAGDELSIGLCGLHIEDDLKALNKRQRAGFYRKYKDNCDCSIEYCYGDNCDSNSHDQCIVTPRYSFYDFMSCANRYSMCKRKHGRCQWTKNRKHTTCQNEAMKRFRYKH